MVVWLEDFMITDDQDWSSWISLSRMQTLFILERRNWRKLDLIYKIHLWFTAFYIYSGSFGVYYLGASFIREPQFVLDPNYSLSRNNFLHGCQFTGGVTSDKLIRRWKILWCSVVWNTWIARNSCIFRDQAFDRKVLMQNIMFHTWCSR